MLLPARNSKTCRRDSQDDSESPLTYDKSLESASKGQDIESDQQARLYSSHSSWDDANAHQVKQLEEWTPTPDGSPTEPEIAPDLPLYASNKSTNVHRCALLPDHVAVWYLKGTGVPLSALAATVLASEGLIKADALKMCWRREYNVAHQPKDPLSGGTMALVGSVTGVVKDVVDLPVGVVRSLGRKPVSRVEESQTQDYIPDWPSNAGGTSSTRISDTIPYYQHSDHAFPPGVEQHSIHVQDSTRDPESPKFQANDNLPSDVQGDVGNTPPNIEHPSQQPKSPPNPSKSHTSTSSSKGLALLTFKSCGRVLETTLAAPLHFTLGMTQGFRNAPTLYGDTTVRPATDVTGWQSGIKTAGKEFGLGMYDGLSGMLTQPYHGAKKEGGLGLVKGVGKGVAGVIAKPGAAVFALPAYTLQGIHTEVQNRRPSTTKASRTDTVIRDELLEQGEREAAALEAEERLGIVRTWMGMRGKNRHGMGF